MCEAYLVKGDLVRPVSCLGGNPPSLWHSFALSLSGETGRHRIMKKRRVTTHAESQYRSKDTGEEVKEGKRKRV